MGNAYTQRRIRMRRPPVCKSKKPMQKMLLPALVIVDPSWNITNGMDTSSWGAGEVQLDRVGLTNQYHTTTVDDQGNPVAFTFTLQQGGVLCYLLIEITSALLGDPTPNGTNETWPGTPSFTSGRDPLSEPTYGTVGDYAYTVPAA